MPQLSIRDLPPEIRELIWGHVLVVGSIQIDEDLDGIGVVSTWPMDQMGKAMKPGVAILRLSQTFLIETEPILYKRNTFFLRSEASIERFLDVLHTSREDRRPWLHKIQIALGYHDMCHFKDACIGVESDIAMFGSDLRLLDANDNDADTEYGQGYGFWYHRVRKERKQKHSWPRKLDRISRELNPHHVTLDLLHAYCEPARCCSMQASALMQLKDVKFSQGVPELHVLGLWGFMDDMPLTLGDEKVRSLWRFWSEPGAVNSECSKAEDELKKAMEKEMKNDGRWAR